MDLQNCVEDYPEIGQTSLTMSSFPDDEFVSCFNVVVTTAFVGPRSNRSEASSETTAAFERANQQPQAIIPSDKKINKRLQHSRSIAVFSSNTVQDTQWVAFVDGRSLCACMKMSQRPKS